MFEERSVGKQVEDYNVNCSKFDTNGRLELEGISQFKQHQHQQFDKSIDKQIKT